MCILLMLITVVTLRFYFVKRKTQGTSVTENMIDNDINDVVENTTHHTAIFVYPAYKNAQNINEYDLHLQQWVSALPNFFILVQRTHSKRELSDLIHEQTVKSTSESILLTVFCGHGTENGKLLLANNEALSYSDFTRMINCYRGTVVSFHIYCHSGLQQPVPYGDFVPKQEKFFLTEKSRLFSVFITDRDGIINQNQAKQFIISLTQMIKHAHLYDYQSFEAQLKNKLKWFVGECSTGYRGQLLAPAEKMPRKVCVRHLFLKVLQYIMCFLLPGPYTRPYVW